MVTHGAKTCCPRLSVKNEDLRYRLPPLTALTQWLTAPEAAHAHLFFGGSWRVCPLLIVLVSAPIYAAIVLALRQMAPTNPIAAGAAAGLFALGTAGFARRRKQALAPA